MSDTQTEVLQPEQEIGSPDSQVPYTPPSRKGTTPLGGQKLIFFVGAFFVGILVIVFLFSHKMTATKKNQTGKKANVQIAQNENRPVESATPTDAVDPRVNQSKQDPDSISPEDVLQTKNSLLAQQKRDEVKVVAQQQPTAPFSAPVQQKGPNGQPIGNIPPFSATNGRQQPWTATPYGGTGPGNNYAAGNNPQGTAPTAAQPGVSYQEQMRAWNEEVQKPSTLFTKRTAGVAGSSTTATPTPAPGNSLPSSGPNFGLQSGYRVAARLEMGLNTASGIPIVAVVEHNYQLNGHTVIPAGSRAIGKVEQFNVHGYVAVRFQSFVMPNGVTVPISAGAVDTNLQALRGHVTGNPRKMAMLIATMSGIGQTAALTVGGSNNSAAFTSQDMMRQRMSQNIGTTADSQLQSLIANQQVVVTVPAGQEIYIVFHEPAAVPTNVEGGAAKPALKNTTTQVTQSGASQ